MRILSFASGKFKLVSLLLFFILLITLVDAQQSSILRYSLHEPGSEANVTGVSIQVREKNLLTDKEVIIREYISSNVIDLYVLPGIYRIELIIDDGKTEGKDYFFREEVDMFESRERKAYVFPVASLRGSVVDNLNNLVGSADVRLECAQDLAFTINTTTSKYGTFMFPIAPAGKCIITASSNNFLDEQELAFNRGDFETVELKLQQKVHNEEPDNNLALLIALVSLAVIVIGAIVVFLRFRSDEPDISLPPRRRRIKNAMKQEQKNALSKRADDVLQTLKEREKIVAQFLLENKGVSTQSKIKHATKIPKTSLIRILAALQEKKVVNLKSEGMMKNVELTEWFLGK